MSAMTQTARRRPFIVLSILLLASLACVLPFMRSQPPTATPQPVSPTPKILPPTATPSAPLPPALVEAQPQPGSEISGSAGVTLYFNQRMDRPSTEAALRSSPNPAGTIKWVDDSTLQFQPSGRLTPGSQLNLTLEGARAANGLEQPAPILLQYQVAEPLRVAERIPRPGVLDAGPSSAVVVTFTRPVVALGADPADLPTPIQLSPATPGRGEWVNTSTYIFTPETALQGGAAYTVTIDPALTALDGTPLDLSSLDPVDWTFTTVQPSYTAYQGPEEEPADLDPAFVITFNQPMNRASVEAAFRLSDADNQSVQGAFSWNDSDSEVTFKPSALLKRSALYAVTLSTAATNPGGSPITQALTSRFVTVPNLEVTGTQPAAGTQMETYSGYGSLQIVFSAPLAAQNFADLVSFDPPVGDISFYSGVNSRSLSVSGYFQPSTLFTIRISGALKDRWGQPLGESRTLQIETARAEPSLVIPMLQIGSQAIFLPAGETSLPARATNITYAGLSRARMSIPELISAVSNGGIPFDIQARAEDRWNTQFSLAGDSNEPVNLPLASSNRPLPTGIYAFEVSIPQINGNPKIPFTLVSSRVQMSVKAALRQAFVWVVDLQTNTPLASAPVDFYDVDGTSLGRCTTGGDGACSIEFDPRVEPYRSVIAVSGKPGETYFGAVSSGWNQGISPWEYGVGLSFVDTAPLNYLYTDRPI